MDHVERGKLHLMKSNHLVEILKKKLAYWIGFHLLLLQEDRP